MDMKDILTFKTMVTPMIVQVLFWIFVVLAVLGGLASIFQGQFLAGLGMIIIGPLVIRIYAELIMVIFKINQGVQDLNKK